MNTACQLFSLTHLHYCNSLFSMVIPFRTKLIKTSPKSIPEVADNLKKPILETQDQDDLRGRILSKVCSTHHPEDRF
jgi:kinesin family member 5